MDRLNYFNPYKTKGDKHEDHLSRAFLILLRHSFQVTAIFYDLCRRNYESRSGEKIKGSKLPGLSELYHENWLFATQKSNPKILANLLLSVLITDEELEKRDTVKRSKRNARYDGLILFGEQLAIVIENKPRFTNVWAEQLSPSEHGLSEDTEILPSAAVIEWKEIIRQLTNLASGPMVVPQERMLINDFLEFVDQDYPELNPFDNFALCKDNEYLLHRRIQNILKKIVVDPTAVDYHRNWGDIIWINFDEIYQIGLILHTSEKKWWLELTLYFADTVTQSRFFYAHSIIYSSLIESGWIAKPHFHLSVRSQNLVWYASPNLPLYLNYWQTNHSEIRQYKRKEIQSMINHLHKKRVILNDEESQKRFKAKFLDTKIQAVNLCPGFGLIYKYESDKAIKLDENGQFEKEIKQKIRQALTILPASRQKLDKLLKS